MKKFASYLFVFITCFQTPALAVQKPEAILEGHILKVKFIQKKTISALPKPILTKGKMILWSGKGLIWKTTEPFLTMLLITKKGLFQVDNGNKSPLMQRGGEGSIFEMIMKLIHGSLEDIDGFTVTHLPSSREGWAVRLSPTHSQIQGFLKDLEVEGDHYIKKITIHRENGDQDEIMMCDHTLVDATKSHKVLIQQEQRLFDD